MLAKLQEYMYGLVLLLIISVATILPSLSYAEMYMSVSGKVASENSIEGIGDANIVLLSENGDEVATARSYSNGNFILKKVPAGKYYVLTESSDNYAIDGNDMTPVQVNQGKNIVGLQINLREGGAIKGKISASSGHVLNDVEVVSNGTNWVKTDENGYFYLKGVIPGQSEIIIVGDSISTQSLKVDVSKGQTLDVGEIEIPVSVESSIQGFIKDKIGTPITEAIIIITSNGEIVTYSTPSADGYFYVTGLNVKNSYVLSVVGLGYEQHITSSVTVPLNNMNIVLESSTNDLSGLLSYKFEKKEYKIMSFLEEVVSYALPKNVYAEVSCDCPEGDWIGFRVFLIFKTKVYSKIKSLGIYYCKGQPIGRHNNPVGVNGDCDLIGASTSAISSGVRISYAGCEGIYNHNDFFQNSRVVITSANYGKVAWSKVISQQNRCTSTWSIGGTLISWPLLRVGLSGGVLSCSNSHLRIKRYNQQKVLHDYIRYGQRG